MIIPFGALVLGLLLGAVRARLRGGKVKDILQWALVYAILFAVVGLFVMIYLDRTLQG